MTEKEYRKFTKQNAPASPLLRDCLWAFAAGGTLCAAGQLIIDQLQRLGMEALQARSCASLCLVALSAVLTALHSYDGIAKHAGAGLAVPITGFANSIACAAMEFKSEGFVLGVGAKMFVVAGPVIVYGTVASVVYGLIYWILQML